MNDSTSIWEKPLQDATVQEIQLELLRRTQHNALDGEQVVGSLFRHRDLWLAVLLDRLYLWTRDPRPELPLSGLIKLRDLPYNDWNADTLYILTDSVENARRLAGLIEEEDWAGMVRVFNDPNEVGRALGAPGDWYSIVRVWWD